MSAQEESRHDAEHEAVTSATPTPEGPAHEGSAQEGPAYVGPAQEGPAHDGAAQESPAYEALAGGSAQEGPAYEGPAHEGSAQESPAQEGLAGDGSAQEGPAQGGPAHEGSAQEDPAQEGVAGDGSAQEGPAREGLAGDGSPHEKLVHGGSPYDGLVHEGSPYDNPTHDGLPPDGLPPDGPPYDDRVFDGPVHGGMDALLAALLDEPLSEEALRDAEFVASRDAAAGDIALLREQLGLIGDALAGPVPAAGEDAVAGASPGRSVAARPGDAAGAETDPGRVSGPATAPTASVTPLSPRPSRARARRALKITFGTLAAAAAASVVLGLGWVVVQTGGGANVTSSDSGSAKSESQAQTDEGGEADLRDGEGYVACARLIVEGTVTEVEPVPGLEQDRITVEVDRWIKPDKGADQVVFPMDQHVDPRLSKGDHVLVGIPKGSAQPDLWATREAEIARDRAWIEAALSGTGSPTCE